MDSVRNAKLRAMCRDYLMRLRYLAKKHGMYGWWKETVAATNRSDCEPTENEVRMLSRIVDDERLSRQDVPKVLGKSYRQCNEDGDFERIRKLRRVGIYSKVSAILNRKE